MQVFDYLVSDDALTAILDLIVHCSPPIVLTFLDEAFGKSFGFTLRHHFMCWEESFLECSDGVLSILEAWEIFLAEHHHFNKDDNFVSVFLKGHETKLDEVSE